MSRFLISRLETKKSIYCLIHRKVVKVAVVVVEDVRNRNVAVEGE